MITLLKYFTFAGANGSNFPTEWVRVPEDFQNWQFTVVVHSRTAGTAATVQLITTWDTANITALGSTESLATTGNHAPQDIASGVGPMVRLQFLSTADSVAVLSVYLTPKSE
jgi:hypothetical protein